MTQASVGFHCPACVKGQGQKVLTARQLRTDPVATKVLVGLNVAAFLAIAVSARGGGAIGGVDGDLAYDLGLYGPWVAQGEWWRLVTSGFLHAGLAHLAMNMLALWILGGLLEPVLGRVRFVGLYVASLLAGSAGALLVEPDALTVGASGAIFGLMGAAVALQRSRGIDPWRSGLGGLIAVNLAFTFLVPGISVGGHVGGLVGGAVTGVAVFALERRTESTAAAVAVCAAASVAFVGVALWAADRSVGIVLGALAAAPALPG